MPSSTNLLQLFAPLLKLSSNNCDPTQCPQGMDYEPLDKFYERAKTDKELQAAFSPDPDYVNKFKTILALLNHGGHIVRKRGDKNTLSICLNSNHTTFKRETAELDPTVLNRAAHITNKELTDTCGEDPTCLAQGDQMRAFAKAMTNRSRATM